MSWQTFKDNLLEFANNPASINDTADVAKKWADEYDAAIKRGKDVLNQVSLKQGNKAAMEQLFKSALDRGLSTTTDYDLVGEMGKGVIAYWTGATLNEFPIPTIPATGATSNVQVTTNIVVNAGTWQPAVIVPGAQTPDEDEAEAIKRDIDEEYPANQELYEAEFETEEAAMENNSNVTEEDAYKNIEEYNSEIQSDVNTNDSDSDVSETNPPSGTPPTPPSDDLPPKSPPPVAKGDQALFKRCGNGVWPALGTAPNFDISSTQSGKCPRYWYKVNKEYMVKNCTEIMFPTSNGDKKILVHKDLAAIVKPAIAKIKQLGLQKYIKNCGGGLAVRNVTCGTRLSNHSWGTAIDMNTEVYPYGYTFKSDGIYSGGKKIRDLNEFDNGFKQVAAIFKSQGMTWLSNNDPMHVSIYE
jgi:hypothetical protein